MTSGEIKRTFLDNLVRYWLLIITGVGLIASVAVAGEKVQALSLQVETLAVQVKRNEERVNELLVIKQHMKNISKTQDRIIQMLLSQREG